MKFRAVLFAVLVLSPALASAQEKSEDRPSLTLPTMAFAGAAVGDWVTTYYGISHQKFVEGNHLISPMQKRPALMISVGAAMDVAGWVIWKRYVARNHPKIGAAGLYSATAFRMYLCLRGVTLIRQPTPMTTGRR